MEGQWHFFLTAGLNAARPCHSPESKVSIEGPGSKLVGVDALKLALNELPGGESIIWCGIDLPDSGLIEDVISYGETIGIDLSLVINQQSDSTLPDTNQTEEALYVASHSNRHPDPSMTSPAATPDGLLWYIFDVAEAIGGSQPGPDTSLFGYDHC